MANAKTETAKKTRGEGPVIVMFGGDKGEATKRPASGTNMVIVADKAGAKKSYSLSSIPSDVQSALVAYAFGSRVKTFINNHAKDGAVNVIEMTDQIFSDFINGKMYSRTESEGGAPRGRQFDPADYVEALKQAKAAQFKAGAKNKHGVAVKEATEKELEAFGNQLISLKGKDRTAKIKNMKENAVFLKYFLAVQAKKIKAEVGVSIDDMF